MSKIKEIIEQVTVTVDGEVFGEWVRKDTTYTTTRRADGNGDVHFRNVATGGGTYMAKWNFDRAIKNGWIVRPAPKGWDVAETSVEA